MSEREGEAAILQKDGGITAAFQPGATVGTMRDNLPCGAEFISLVAQTDAEVARCIEDVVRPLNCNTVTARTPPVRGLTSPRSQFTPQTYEWKSTLVRLGAPFDPGHLRLSHRETCSLPDGRIAWGTPLPPDDFHPIGILRGPVGIHFLVPLRVEPRPDATDPDRRRDAAHADLRRHGIQHPECR